MKIIWTDATEEDPIIYSSGRGRRGMYYFGKVSTGFCISMDIPSCYNGGGTAFIGNTFTIAEAKGRSQEFDDSNEKLSA